MLSASVSAGRWSFWRHLKAISWRGRCSTARARGVKVLLFTYYKDTARYLYRRLGSDDPAALQWRTSAAEPRIRRMDSGADARERARLVAHFAPHANNKPELAGSDSEIDIL